MAGLNHMETFYDNAGLIPACLNVKQVSGNDELCKSQNAVSAYQIHHGNRERAERNALKVNTIATELTQKFVIVPDTCFSFCTSHDGERKGFHSCIRDKSVEGAHSDKKIG